MTSWPGNLGGAALDEPVEPASGERYGPDIEPRLSRVETEVRDLKDTQAELKSIVARIEAKLDAVLPHLATKADLAPTQSGLATMQATLDSVLPHLATKADLTKMQATLDATLPHPATKAD